MNAAHLAVRVLGSAFFAGWGVVFAGLTVEMGYESIAIWTRTVPTISAITAGELMRHPVWWITAACGACFVLGALVTHFSHWTPAG